MTKKRKPTRDPDKLGGPVDSESPLMHEAAIQRLSSNLYGLLVKEPYLCRFFKVLHREEHSWLAIIGSYDEDDQPIVCFGNGASYAAAVYSLGRSMSAGQWREDKYAG